MKAYSVDLRTRVLAALDRGMPRAEIVTTFPISMATLKRWLALRRTQGHLTPRVPPGLPPTITPDQEMTLRAQLAQYPDATLAEHAAMRNTTHGTTLSQWTLGRAIRRLEWPRKKRP